MKNTVFMKKMLSLLLALSMLLAFAGCSKNEEAPTTNGSEPESSGAADQQEVFVKPENYATILSVTINPQFRLYLDANGIVLAVEAVNKDAEEIEKNISFENDSYETVLERIVTKAEEKDYIKSDAVIHVEVTEAKDPTVDTAVMLDKVTITVNQTATRLELTVEIKTEDKTAGDKQPDVDEPDLPAVPPAPAPCVHTYKDATCTAPKTCTKCGATEGSAAGHSWKDATCTAPKTCSKCSATEGSAAGHSWKDATCTAPKTCSKCSATEGSAAGHSWNDATCTAPKTCTKCSATEGSAAGHSWNDATCTAPKTCSACGATTGDKLPHTYQNGLCIPCGDRQLGYGTWRAVRPSKNASHVLIVLDVGFGNNSGEGGIGYYEFHSVDSLDETTLQNYLDRGAETLIYQGKEYICYTGAGDPIYYESTNNTITVCVGSPGYQEDSFTLQKSAENQATVTAVTGCSFYGISEDMVFTYKDQA